MLTALHFASPIGTSVAVHDSFYPAVLEFELPSSSDSRQT